MPQVDGANYHHLIFHVESWQNYSFDYCLSIIMIVAALNKCSVERSSNSQHGYCAQLPL